MVQPPDRAFAPQTLENCEDCLQGLVKHSPIPVMLHAEDGEVLQISQTWTTITGYSHTEIPTIADWTERAYGTRKEQICRQIDQLYQLERQVNEGEFCIRTQSGELRVWEFYSSPLGTLPDGRRLINSSAVDVTERKQVESELRQTAIELENQTTKLERSNADLEMFSQMAAHDLATPLRTIQGFTQELITDPALPSNQDDLRRILAIAKRMDRLLLNLLALSRINRLTTTLKPINLDLIVHEVLESLSTPPSTQIVVAKPLGIVLGNRTLLIQVVSNLLANAVKFVAPSTIPAIQITSETRSSDWIRLSIQDNGIGIPTEAQTRIFAPFERLHGADFYSGTGLGLTIVQRAIERIGGRVGVESWSGKGSRFWVELPQFANGAATRESPNSNPVN
jgi:PAS domain S-box-containing protein